MSTHSIDQSAVITNVELGSILGVPVITDKIIYYTRVSTADHGEGHSLLKLCRTCTAMSINDKGGSVCHHSLTSSATGAMQTPGRIVHNSMGGLQHSKTA